MEDPETAAKGAAPEPEPMHDTFVLEEAQKVEQDADVLSLEAWCRDGWYRYAPSGLAGHSYKLWRLATQEPLDPDAAERIARALEGWETHNGHGCRRRVRAGLVERFENGAWIRDPRPQDAFTYTTWHLRRPGTAERMAREREEANRTVASELAAEPVDRDADARADRLIAERADPPRRHAELTEYQAHSVADNGVGATCVHGVWRLTAQRPLTEREARRVGEALPGATFLGGACRYRVRDGEWERSFVESGASEKSKWTKDVPGCARFFPNEGLWLESVPAEQEPAEEPVTLTAWMRRCDDEDQGAEVRRASWPEHWRVDVDGRGSMRLVGNELNCLTPADLEARDWVRADPPKPPVDPRHDLGQVLVWMIQTGRKALDAVGDEWRYNETEYGFDTVYGRCDPEDIALPCTPADGGDW